MNKELVAVYGTLKKGESNHYLLKDSTFVAEGITNEEYDMVSMGSFPSIISGGKIIKVEIYEVDEATLKRLDQLEGHPHFYRRDKVEVFNNGITYSPYIYKVVKEETILNRPRISPDSTVIDWSYKNKVSLSELIGCGC
jgi:gamma-glutamylcyclotransferase (GGCT)/AIG2-like uncharacterized protein YtfP